MESNKVKKNSSATVGIAAIILFLVHLGFIADLFKGFFGLGALDSRGPTTYAQVISDLHPLFVTIVVLSAAILIVGIVATLAIIQRKKWARILALVDSGLLFLFSLWILLPTTLRGVASLLIPAGSIGIPFIDSLMIVCGIVSIGLFIYFFKFMKPVAVVEKM